MKKINKNYFFIVIIILLCVNLFCILFTNKKQTKCDDIVLVSKNCPEPDKEYQENKKYYKEINYKQFKEINKKNNLTYIAVVDNSSSTYNKFLELINKLSYKYETKIYVLEISKLNKKNTVSFYDIDERFRKTGSNFIICTKKNKILSFTDFDNEKINNYIEGL